MSTDRHADRLEPELIARAAANLAAMRADDSHPWPGYLASALVREPTRLTSHECRVIVAASYGLSSPMIGDLLGITLETVKTHKRTICGKLGAKNTTHAVALAIRSGAIQ